MIRRIEQGTEGAVGWKRYLLCGLFFFPFGLMIQYMARDYGWLGWWITLVLGLLIAILAMSSGWEAEEVFIGWY